MIKAKGMECDGLGIDESEFIFNVFSDETIGALNKVFIEAWIVKGFKIGISSGPVLPLVSVEVGEPANDNSGCVMCKAYAAKVSEGVAFPVGCNKNL